MQMFLHSFFPTYVFFPSQWSHRFLILFTHQAILNETKKKTTRLITPRTSVENYAINCLSNRFCFRKRTGCFTVAAMNLKTFGNEQVNATGTLFSGKVAFFINRDVTGRINSQMSQGVIYDIYLPRNCKQRIFDSIRMNHGWKHYLFIPLIGAFLNCLL